MLYSKIVSLAKEAGDEIMKFYRASDLRVETKSDDSPLTQADLRANEIILKGLKEISNEIVVSEESELNKSLDLREKKFWLVDPLDGTRDFVAGLGSFCVSIALIENCRPILGVLYSPVLNEVFWAQKNQGSFLNDKKIYNSSDRSGLYALASGATHPSERMKNFLNISKVEKLTRYGSALKFGHLARGDADIYPRFGETSEWDTAAGQIICEEAGCEVLDLRTLKPLQYAKPAFRNSGFMSVRKDLVATFHKILSDIQSQLPPKS